jgi:mevalonate kinase
VTNKTKKTYYSNGKLLITGEYLVLDGAQAFALPTKFGQNLIVEEDENEVINWKSFDSDGSIWFEDCISFSSIIQQTYFEKDSSIKNKLIEILHEAYLMQPEFITKAKGYSIYTELTFPKLWGLGTSSTLINNIAQWLNIDAFKLLQRSFGGSGYDIACAQNTSPIIYQLQYDNPIVKTITFKPPFTQNLFFVYLNKKQNSRTAIASYYGKNGEIEKNITKIDAITHDVITASSAKEFALALEHHEIEMSNILELKTIKESLFPDFNGVIKSLGAWGGDFVLSISKENPTAYFNSKGFNIVIPYSDMIL